VPAGRAVVFSGIKMQAGPEGRTPSGPAFSFASFSFGRAKENEETLTIS